MTTPEVPTGFEAAHAEWLHVGGPAFRNAYKLGPEPSFYRSHYWVLVKEAVLASKDFKCCRCTGPAKQVHHLNYYYVGEDHLHPDSLVAICRPCHGLVEYARNAESLISKISRRISLCKGFLNDRYREQNPVHVVARLLEYQDDLAELRRLFTAKTFYQNRRYSSEAEAAAFHECFEQKRQAYHDRAVNFLSAWDGGEKDKAERLLPMLEAEIQNCRDFINEVFAPVPPRLESAPSEGETDDQARPKRRRPSKPASEVGGAAVEIESLVVGIKFHRGHVDGIFPGDNVILVREPDNAYDPNAIQVQLETGEILGYLTREFAAAYASEMDAGLCSQAKVSRIVRDKIYVAVSPVGPLATETEIT